MKKKNSNTNVLQIFAYCEQIVSRLWADCERQSWGKSKWSRKTSHNVRGIPVTMWGTNLNEDAYCVHTLEWKQKSSSCDCSSEVTPRIFVFFSIAIGCQNIHSNYKKIATYSPFFHIVNFFYTVCIYTGMEIEIVFMWYSYRVIL